MTRYNCCLLVRKGRLLFLLTFIASILMIIQVSVIPAAPATQPIPSLVKNQERDNGPKGIALEVGYGYRRDSFDWNIAGDLKGNNPNVLSELKWDDLIIHEARLGLRVEPEKAFVWRGSINYGVIVSGDNRDSDYAADNRGLEFSRSVNDADKGHTLDTQLGAGYRFQLISESFSLVPLAGYSYHRQHLSMTDGFQKITWPGGPPLGPFEGLDSSYDATWMGPWLGFEMAIEAESFAKTRYPISFYASWEYHWADYHAEANWNLRDDFKQPKSFEHEADGNGTVASLGVCIRLSEKWLVTLGYETEEWSTERGVDRVFLDNDTIIKTRLNEVNWHSDVFHFGCSVRF